MDTLLAIALVVGTLFILFALGMPIFAALMGGSLLLMFFLWGPDSLYVSYSSVMNILSARTFISCPLYILMALMLEASGLGNMVFDVVFTWFGKIKGSLALGGIVANTIIGAMTGITSTGTVIMAVIAYPKMVERNYSRALSLGVITAGGCLGMLIPPSVFCIVVGGFFGASIGALFIGMLVPGLITSASFLIYIFIRSYLQPDFAPASTEPSPPWGEKFRSLFKLLPPMLIIVIILGSIYSGAATPTEAGGVGAFAVMVYCAATRKLTWKVLKSASIETLKFNGMLLWMIAGGFAFSSLIVSLGIADALKEIIFDLNLTGTQVTIIAMLVALVMGMFVDATPIIMILYPVIYPLMTTLNIDPVYFGVLLGFSLTIGLISPPFGYQLFTGKAVLPSDVTMGQLYRSVIPWCLILVGVLILMLCCPAVVTWLPSMMN